MTSVSFIGLGAMGFGMATNLARSGFIVTGFDLNPAAMASFRERGGQTAATAAEAVADKPFCVLMVATMAQAHSVLFGNDAAVLSALPKNVVLFLSSTVPWKAVRQFEQTLAENSRADIALVDCPVSGGAIRAAEGTLSIMAGGSDAAIARGREILETMSAPEKLYIVKGGVGAGSKMKMCHQVLAAIQILASSEAVGFAARLGLDAKEAGEALVASEAWSWMLENRLPRILDGALPVASAVNIIVKDTGIITEMARDDGFPTPMTSTAEQAYFYAVSSGYGFDDDGTLVRLYQGNPEVVSNLNATVTSSTSKKEQDLEMVVGLLRGIHLCATVEALSFAKHIGLDLDQVAELCINAAGGSKVLSATWRQVLRILDSGDARGEDIGVDLGLDKLFAAVAHAQKIKAPLFLGAEALCLLIRSGAKATTSVSRGDLASLVNVWKTT